ncbi:MAG: HAD-IIA family hydrolase [Ruminococcaceae bacterium]|nr:HAD-IIA family hydrolase [Oscillospiraceae bacterium]
MDGTIYLDNNLFPGVIPFLENIKKKGGRYIFMTNNSSKGVESYIEKMNRFGIATTKEDYVTSVNVTAIHLEKMGYKKIYVFGTESFKTQLRSAGLSVCDTLSDDIDCLCVGFDTELTFRKLEEACILLGRDIDYVASHPDLVCPTAYGSVPDCGSVCDMLYNATGRRPLVLGKPEPAMPLLAMEKTGFSKEQTVVLGDRIYTDIACGIRAGVDAVLVLSGEGTREDAERATEKPTYVYEDIRHFSEDIF